MPHGHIGKQMWQQNTDENTQSLCESEISVVHTKRVKIMTWHDTIKDSNRPNCPPLIFGPFSFNSWIDCSVESVDNYFWIFP